MIWWTTLKTRLYFLVKLLFFWIVLFDAMRLLFMFHNAKKITAAGWLETGKAFVHSLQLDLSTAAILSIGPFLFYVIWKSLGYSFLKKTYQFIFGLFILLVVVIHAGEINAYPEWNHKLSTKVFIHLSNPDEVGRTASWTMVFWFTFYMFIGLAVAYLVRRKLFHKDINEVLKPKIGGRLASVLSFILFAPLLVIAARGGLQPIPINVDAANYSSANIANDLSINSTYYFGKSFLLYNRSNLDDVFPKMNIDKAIAIRNKLYSNESNTSHQILDTIRPNLVFVVLEGWSANTIKSITGKGGVTPHFDKLTQKGLLFTRFYANGGTSEIGNATIFGGFPALPEISMSMQPEKHRKLPALNQDLKKEGYYASYLFSGDLTYGNIHSFFSDHGFDNIQDENDFPKNLPRGRLNYYDEDLFSFFLKNINASPQPFLQCAFTGSTHSPYDFPKRKNQTYVGPEQEYMNSMIYADESLHQFIEKCKKESWYKNTLFVLVADHGHTTPDLSNPNNGDYFHIPLLFFGEVLKKEFRGKKIDIVGSQNDIVATLLQQMKLPTAGYPWSKNLLNPSTKSFALHTVTRGYGWITDTGNFSYNLDSKSFLDQNYTPAELKKQSTVCKAYLVELYRQFKAL